MIFLNYFNKCVNKWAIYLIWRQEKFKQQFINVLSVSTDQKLNLRKQTGSVTYKRDEYNVIANRHAGRSWQQNVCVEALNIFDDIIT